MKKNELYLKYQVQWRPLNSHGKCMEKSYELSEHVNYPSLFYVTFLSMVESCVQSKLWIKQGVQISKGQIIGLYCITEQ